MAPGLDISDDDHNGDSNEPRKLPPNIDLATFNSFIQEAENICGGENVTIISKTNTLNDGDYMHPCKGHDMHAIYDRDFFVGSAVVCPREVPEVQAVMKLCNEMSMFLALSSRFSWGIKLLKLIRSGRIMGCRDRSSTNYPSGQPYSHLQSTGDKEPRRLTVFGPESALRSTFIAVGVYSVTFSPLMLVFRTFCGA